MITKQDLVDAVQALAADVQNGCADLDEPLTHDRIAALLDCLPDASEQGATRPLHVIGVAPEDLGAYVGYRFFAYVPTESGNRSALVTIASVRRNGDTIEVAVVEFPGYHVAKRTALTDLWAPVWDVAKPVEPTESDSDAHPDLIDRDRDRWRWRAGYVCDNGEGYMASREDVDRGYGPVRDA